MIVFKLDIGGNHLYLSSEDKPKLIDGYVHLEGGEHEGLSYKLRDEQVPDYETWISFIDRNTGLIDLNEGDRAAFTQILARIEGNEFELQDDYAEVLNEIGAIAARSLGVEFGGIGGIQNED